MKKDVKIKHKDKKGKIFLNDDIKYIFKLYIITRIILLILMVVAEFLLKYKFDSQYHHVFELFDNEHYLNIANNGYISMFELAFFPLTPLLIRYLGKVGFIILNQVCVILSSCILYLISDRILKKDDKYFATLLFLVSPISVFTGMFYSESLFIFLTLTAYYLYKTKKNYFVLGVVLGLSVLTRSLGSMLFFTIFIFMFIKFVKKKEKFKNILITYIPATIISCIYPIYLYVRTGDFLYFITVQYEYWGRVSSNIFKILVETAQIIFNNNLFLHYIDYFILLGLLIYIIVNIVKNKNEKDYYDLYLYLILSIVSICSTRRTGADALASYYRYICGCFSLYLLGKKSYIIFSLIVFISMFTAVYFLLGIYFY